MIKDNFEFVVLEFDLPEFEFKDIKVNVEGNRIDIEAFKEEDNKIKEEDIDWFEKIRRSFSYSSSLPPVVGEKAKVEFLNGRLKLIIPRK